MLADTEVKTRGFQVLLESLGELNAERFIALILREPFDYTEWQRTLLADATVREISKSAMRFRGESCLTGGERQT
jgi:hypothetical protein